MSRFRAAFWNERESRLRAGWRLVIHTACMMAFMAGASRLVEGLGVDLEISGDTPLGVFFIPGTMMLVGALVTTWLAGRLLDRRRFSDFGFQMDRAWWFDFWFGLGLGALLMTLVFVVEWSAGWITVVDTFHTRSPEDAFGASFLVFVVLFVCVGFAEELLSRGYHIKNLAEGLRSPRLDARRAVLLAWLISSVAFGLLHASNPNASVVSVLNIIVAGLAMGSGYVLTGQLALPIGMHISWNLFLGNVYGFPVSGRSAPADIATVVSMEQSGPELWTGGAFGPEAGLVGLFAALVGALAIFLWVRRRGRPVGVTRLFDEHAVRPHAP
jgi:membrane protease YdiL (CAAX protease family)